MAIYVRHIALKWNKHRTLISTMHKPWYLKILFWIKPMQVDYIGCGTTWYHLATDLPVPAWLSKQLQQFESKERLKRHNTKKSLGYRSTVDIGFH